MRVSHHDITTVSIDAKMSSMTSRVDGVFEHRVEVRVKRADCMNHYTVVSRREKRHL